MKIFDKIKNNKIVNSLWFARLLVVLLAIYPMRFCNRGLDLWDTGFNIINFIYDDINYMGEVNFFSYFLANQVGHLFTLMPISNNLVVLRILCSLFVSTEIVISTLFCLNKLKLNKWLVFLGEFVAVSLCYSPSVILYNHISFLILLASIMLIYTGLTEEKKYCLFFAGACLGLGLYVRFSNAVFPLLILAVFYYCYLNKSKAAEWAKCTIYCILGFAVSFFALYVCIGIKYGFSAYYDGIMKLFSISENAKGYSAFSMLAESLKGYVMGARSILVTVLVAILSMLVYSMALKRVNKEKAVLAKAVISGCASACVILLMLVCKWINLKPYFYGIIYYSAALFADLIIILFAKTFFDRKADANNKLIMLLLFLWIVVLSVGSGTGISPVINSMFLGSPVMLAKLYDEIKKEIKNAFLNDSYKNCFKVFLANTFVSMMIVLIIHCGFFGAAYVYEEAGNGLFGTSKVSDSPILKGTLMSEERAELIGGLNEYIDLNDLRGSDCIVYGYAPSLAYVLGVRPVISSWPDLESYSVLEMKNDINKIFSSVEALERECPLIIEDNEPSTGGVIDNPEKIAILNMVKEKYGYTETYTNGRYSIWTSLWKK